MKTILRPALLLAVVSFASSTFAQAPALVPVQGYLTDDQGAALDGDTTIELAVFDAASDGSSLYTESQVVDVDSGYFTIELGMTDTLDLSIFRDNSELWLEMTIDSETLAPRIQLATAPFAAFAEYAGDAETLSGATLAEVTAAPTWDDIEAIPDDIADGDDVGEVDLSGYQKRVYGTCGEGSAIRTIDTEGAVTCEPDDDTDTTYGAGFGLDLTATEFAVDTNAVQARVVGTCGAGSSIRVVNSDGTVACEPDDDTNTTYSAGAGLSLLGTVFSLAESGVGTREVSDTSITERDLDYRGAGAVASETDEYVWSHYSRASDTSGVAEGRVMVAVNGGQTRGAHWGGAGTATIDGCGVVAQEIALESGGARSWTYLSDPVDLSSNCSLSVRVRSTDETNPVVVREISLVPDDPPLEYAAGTGLELTDTTFSIAADAVGPDEVDLPYGHGTLSNTLEFGDNYLILGTAYTPTSDGVCLVTSTVWWSPDVTDTSAPYTRTARRVGTGDRTNDRSTGPYLPAVGGTKSAPGTTMYPWPVSAGEENRFGCMIYASNDAVGDQWNCRVSWLCF